MKLNFKYKNGKPFNAEEFLKKYIISKYKAGYGITKERNVNNSALHLAVNTLGSFSRNIPARDSLNKPVKEQLNKLLSLGAKEFKNDSSNSFDKKFENSLNKMCFSIINDVVRPTILANGGGVWQKLSPITIKRKLGSEQMLIASGEMFDCLSWRVEKK